MRFLMTLSLPLMLAGCFKGEHADLVIHNAKIYSCDENFTIYEAMAIRDGKIVQLGPEREILNAYTADEVIDAQMKAVYPGFYDAHCHFWGYAETLSEVNLNDSRSLDEVIDRIVKFAEENPDREWIKGRGWDHTLWPGEKYPNNDTLNKIFPDRPVAVRRIDGHAALVNQKALDLAGITPETIIEGGFIEVKDGKCTGILKDNAYDSVAIHIPELPSEEKLKYLQQAEYDLFEQGLTSINDAGIFSNERADYMIWYKNGDLKIKDYAMLFPDDENLEFSSENGIYKKGNLHIRSFKMLSDGAMGSRGACMIEPYSDAPHEFGFMLNDLDYFREVCEYAKEIGYQANIHCIGDSANRNILKIYADVIQDQADHRWKIEHAQAIHPDDYDYFQNVRIVPSVQPTHCTSDMRWVEQRIGKERTKYAYAYKLLLEKAGKIALGTDFPIEDISTFETFYAAVTRQDEKGYPEGGFYPGQKLSREEALKGMTIWAAWSNFEEKERGSLEEGKAADFIILTKDIMVIPEEDILKTYVYKTFLDGVAVFSAE